MNRILITAILLVSICGFSYAQYTDTEVSMGFKEHDFTQYPAGKMKTKGRGRVKYHLVLDGDGKLERADLIRNDFDSIAEETCRKEIESLEFIPPPFRTKGQKFQMTVAFIYKTRFKAFSLTIPKKYP
ncbi:hypothetical protein [Chryseolinea lacunae]|uniref:TonB C-terminal domain-containing protein n=1 Tax=Chryseolinea lacunae TaxID=2801331 RepID=A0ABS1KRZ9_9BACT|nr:hypothetical protein [Chryseolinea lacunae]MBL0741066.1 hypothetical protein [Chryseolinea lacunae]